MVSRHALGSEGVQTWRCDPTWAWRTVTDADLDTLPTALYVRRDELLKQRPDLAPWRTPVGLKPQVTDAEPATVAVLSAVLSFDSDAR